MQELEVREPCCIFQHHLKSNKNFFSTLKVMFKISTVHAKHPPEGCFNDVFIIICGSAMYKLEQRQHKHIHSNTFKRKP